MGLGPDQLADSTAAIAVDDSLPLLAAGRLVLALGPLALLGLVPGLAAGEGLGLGGGELTLHARQGVEIPRDARVKIVGLQDAADLNGCSAKVQRFDAKAGRYRVQLDGEDRCARVRPANLLQLLEVVHVADGAFGRIRDKAVNGEEAQPGARHGYLVNGGAPIFGATDIKSFWACEDTCVPVGTCVRVAYEDPAWDEYDQALVERVDLGRRRYVLRGADGERKVEVAFGAVRV